MYVLFVSMWELTFGWGMTEQAMRIKPPPALHAPASTRASKNAGDRKLDNSPFLSPPSSDNQQ